MSTHNTHKIGVATATIVGMNAMIGSGIFSAPATMAAYVGPAGILAYGFVVIAVWFIALSLARLAQLYPEEGSFYLYASKWGGHVMGLLSSGAYLIGLVIAMGLLAQMAGTYLHSFFSFTSPYNLGLIVLGLLVIKNMFGVTLSSLGQHILIACTLFPLIATIIMCLSKAKLSLLVPFAPYGLTNVFKATRVVIFGFFGFESATSLFTIIRNPEKNLPRALTYSIIIVGSLYTLFIASIILSTPLEHFVDPRMKLSEILAITFSQKTWFLPLIDFAILSAILGTLHSMIWSSSHLMMSLVKQFKNKTIQTLISSGFIQHKLSVLFIGLCISASYLILEKPDLFFYMTAICTVFAYITSMITLLTIKTEWQSGQNYKTILGLITASVIFYFACEGLIQEIIA